MPGLMDPMYWLKTLATGIVISAGATGVLLYACQTKLIYPSDVPAGLSHVSHELITRPIRSLHVSGSRTDVPTPDQFGMPFEDVSLETPDGVKIKAFLMLQRAKPELKPTVLLLHANAGNVVRSRLFSIALDLILLGRAIDYRLPKCSTPTWTATYAHCLTEATAILKDHPMNKASESMLRSSPPSCQIRNVLTAVD